VVELSHDLHASTFHHESQSEKHMYVEKSPDAMNEIYHHSPRIPTNDTYPMRQPTMNAILQQRTKPNQKDRHPKA